MKKNKSIVLIVLCIIAAVIAVLIFKKQSATVDMTQSNGKTTEEKLFSFRTEYIGDASKSSMIAQNLKLDDSFSYYATSLETAAEKPKGITIVYNSLDGNTGLSKAEKYKFIYNSLVVFSLIGNCEVVTASVNKDGTVLPLESIQRDFAVKLLGYDPFTKTTTLDEFKSLFLLKLTALIPQLQYIFHIMNSSLKMVSLKNVQMLQDLQSWYSQKMHLETTLWWNFWSL